MKLKLLYEDIMNEPQFDIDVDEDRVIISVLRNRNTMGRIVLEHIFDAYNEFEEIIEDPEYDFDYDDYVKTFPNDRYTIIEHLEVVDGERGKGYAKLLMTKAINYAKSKGENVMYLNASPMGFSGLNINDLVGFYKSFGFQTLIDSGHNVEMIMNI